MKNIGILGTGQVGQTIGKKLVQLGYNVTLGSRTADNEKAKQWATHTGSTAKTGTFEDAARNADVVFVCTNGAGTLDAIKMAGAENLKGKLVIDLTNPLDFSNGMPPSLLKGLHNTYSLGEAVQDAVPDAKVVKTLNIVNCEVMIDPTKSGGQPTMLLCGNDASAKAEATKLLKDFGWNDILDLGDITASRPMEAYVTLWVRTYMATGNGYNAIKAIR
jgi:8-hydroxy-5-deazaflavin:NADPH oxidoreductase